METELVLKIRSEISEKRNDKNAAFERRLIPDIDEETVLGVYFADLRSIAKKYVDNERIEGFLSDLPHKYHEENIVHALIICKTKDFDEFVKLSDEFLPFVDNWAVCDSMRPKCYARNKPRAKEEILKNVCKKHTSIRLEDLKEIL